MDAAPDPAVFHISPQVVEQAIGLADFDARHAQLQLAPRPRSFYRPPEMTGSPHQGGVLFLLYPKSGQLTFSLTRRTENLGNHRGQISLPGGRQEPGETLAETALREAYEELGVHLDTTRLLGRLASLYIPPSDFEIHPFVAYCPSRLNLVPAPAEVAELIEVPLDQLLDPAVYRNEEWIIRGVPVDVPYYALGGHQVWGATAMVLSEMEHRLRVVLGLPFLTYSQRGSDRAG
jgi:8-oxo-dGTP pyrophosphatase MutT (NUDIX family)